VRARLSNVRPIYTHVRFGRVQPIGAGARSVAANGLFSRDSSIVARQADSDREQGQPA
jgi:hypothetical protein